jgi:hypothetical protein
MAETLNINRAVVAEDGDSADRARLPDHSAAHRRPDRRGRLDSRSALLLAGLAALVTVALGAWLYGEWQRLDADLPAVTGAVRIALLVGLPLMAVVGAGGWLYARAQQARIVRLENDHPISVEAALTGQLAAGALAAHYQTQAVWAANSGLRSLNQLDMSGAKPTDAKASAPAQLQAPAVDLVPDGEWLQWIDRTPHLLIAGRTNAGKTTLATAVLAQRASEQLCVLDPHDQPAKWFGGSAIGGGRDYDAVYDALAGVLAEMDARYAAYNRGAVDFDRLTVLIDEVPAIVLRDKAAWARFASQLGSEARKVSMSMVLLTQSPLVRDIEISSVMRENFTRIALGDQAARLLGDESDARRRQALQELLRGQQHPAAMEYQGEVHLLDTSNVPALARQAGRARLWAPPQAPAQLDASSATRKALAALKARGVTRDAARDVYKLKFENDVWGQV